MRTKKSRKAPITARIAQNLAAPGRRSNHHKATQATIASYHTLIKRRAQLLRQIEKASDARVLTLQNEVHEVDREIDAVGGLAAYQAASKFGQSDQRGGDSARVLIAWLHELGYHRRRVRQLEIGALTHDNYASCDSWLENHAIDLHSQHPQIVEQDFFERPLPDHERDGFDVISCSLVLNFVPNVSERGRMLMLIHQHLRQNTSSLLYLVLPLPCVRNSRYLTIETMKSLFRSVGFEILREKWRPTGKVGYWLWQWIKPSSGDEHKWRSKQLVNDAPGRNNFAILLPG